ncbi:MAG: N-acetylmuramoyl-L-alanine amidase [Bacteroidota bacterium]
MTRFFLLLLFALALCQTSVAQDLSGLGDVIDAPVVLSALEAGTAQPGKRAALVAESQAVALPYTGVALHGYSADRDLAGWIQYDEPIIGWTDWQPLYIVFSATDGFFMAAHRADVRRRGTPFRLRFDLNETASFDVMSAGTFDATLDGRDHPHSHHKAPAPDDGTGWTLPLRSGQAIIPPFLNTRASWNAAPFQNGNPVPLAVPDYEFITFHHAAGFSASTLAQGKAQVKAIQDFHQNGRGWSDIGYQFVVDKIGNVYQGRPFLDGSTRLDQVPRLARGAHAGGANTGNIGVCLLGCYHPPEGSRCEDEISPAALDSLVTLFAFLSESYRVPETNIFGHRDFGSTSCPGDNNYQLLGNIRELTATLKQTGNARLARVEFIAAADADGVVQLNWSVLEDNGVAGWYVERTQRDSTTVLLSTNDVAASTATDGQLQRTGEVTYQLSAIDATGRRQRVAITTLDLDQPTQSVIAQAFPNPTSARTTVRYYLATEGIVRVNVYDALGREVMGVADGFQDAGAWHVFDLDTTTLSSGVYIYRVEVEGFSGITFSGSQTLVVNR